VFNAIKRDPKKSFQSTRIYIDDEGKHLPNHIAFINNVSPLPRFFKLYRSTMGT
jgi:16S rRNA C1402 N4-methylase RsmH